MKIGDIMTTEIKSIKPDISVKEAAIILFNSQISGLPVVDKDNKLIGNFTEKDILRYILPSYVVSVGKFIYEDDSKAITKKVENLANLKVSDIMSKEIITISADISLSEAARIMLTKAKRRLCVVEKNGRLIGIVARCDVLKALMK